MSTRRHHAVAAALLLLLGACGRNPPRPGALRAPRESPVHMGPYAWELPAWWNDVSVRVPAQLADPHELRDWAYETIDTNSSTTEFDSDWREHVKTFVTASSAHPRGDTFPVFLAHFLFAGDQWADAAKVYGDLQGLAATQVDEAAWYGTYLAYEAGRAHVYSGNNAAAREWFVRGARARHHSDPDIAYYAARSQEVLDELAMPDVAAAGAVGPAASSRSCADYTLVPFADGETSMENGILAMRPLRGSRVDEAGPGATGRLVLARGRTRFITEVLRIDAGDLPSLARRWAGDQGGPRELLDLAIPGADAAVVVTLREAVGAEHIQSVGAVFVAAPGTAWRIAYAIEEPDASEPGRCEDLVRRLAHQIRIAVPPSPAVERQ